MWKTIENFDSFLNPSDDDWKIVCETLSIGDSVCGEIVGIAHFGVFINLGTSVPGLLRVPDMKLPRGQLPDSRYKLGDPVEAYVIGFADHNRQVGLLLDEIPDDRRLQGELWESIYRISKRPTELGNSPEFVEGLLISQASFLLRCLTKKPLKKCSDQVAELARSVTKAPSFIAGMLCRELHGQNESSFETFSKRAELFTEKLRAMVIQISYSDDSNRTGP
jgi:hypothetical protein